MVDGDTDWQLMCVLKVSTGELENKLQSQPSVKRPSVHCLLLHGKYKTTTVDVALEQTCKSDEI